jgi:ribosome-binding factor A
LIRYKYGGDGIENPSPTKKERKFTANLLVMQEGKRQKQVAGLLYAELSDIFRRVGLNVVEGGMISISSVKLTPDLLEARVYLSLFQITDQEGMMKKVEEKSREIKRDLAVRVKHQLRRIPELRFYIDETLDHVFKIEELFKRINEEEKPGTETN